MSPVLYDYFQLERWNDIDLVLSAGDLPPYYLDFLCSSLNVPVFYVRGNHDSEHKESSYAGSLNIHGRIVTYRGVRFTGFEGSVRYNQRGYQYTQNQMCRRVWKTRFKALWRGAPDVILAHSPPAGCHDADDPAHRGFNCFRSAIDAWHPAYFIHGHVHSYKREEAISAIDGTTVINAYPYRVIDLEIPPSDQSRPHAAVV